MSEARINIRLPKTQKAYYEFKLKEFASLFDNTKILSVSFGKQDIRGTESICLVDTEHCIPVSKHFNNKWEMLGFVCGFIGSNDRYEEFNRYMRGVKDV